MAKATARPAGDGIPAPRLRRAYYDCRYGQLHVHNAIPAGGGFDELTSVICVHGVGHTGRAFVPLLAALGAQRSVYAPDLPGCGESDSAPDPDFTTVGAHAILDFAESMRIRRFDLLALPGGVAVAKRVAAQRPDAVRRLVTLEDLPTPVSGSFAELLAQLA